MRILRKSSRKRRVFLVFGVLGGFLGLYKCVWDCDPVGLLQTHFGLRPEMEKKRPKYGFWGHRGNGRKMAEKWEKLLKNGSNMGFSTDFRPFFSHFLRSEKLQNESFPNFSNFRPEFCPEFCSKFSPNFSRTFRASFRGRRGPEKIHQKSPPFFNVKFPGKHEKNIHKILLESRQSNISVRGGPKCIFRPFFFPFRAVVLPLILLPPKTPTNQGSPKKSKERQDRGHPSTKHPRDQPKP